jgi:hypothetical protein
VGRPLRIISPEHQALWVDTLRALEAGEVTRGYLLSYHDFSERTLRSRLAEARRWRDDEEGDFGPELDDAPILHLTTDPNRELAGWYDLRSDRTSHDSVGGAVLVGNHSGTRLRRQRLGIGTKSGEIRNDKYKPDATLKGGVG